LFPADTVYGLACDPESEAAVARLYEIKGRPADRPAAVMFFQLERALEALGELGPRTRGALGRLLPGPVTLLLPNPERRFPLACGPVPERLGLRVPDVPLLAGVGLPVMQSSANPSGGADARRLADVDERIRAQVDLEIDGGELPGTASTVIDLSEYEPAGAFAIVREGALGAGAVGAALG
ncbi:MAG TPA: Sua5/YciO/YrdC/YwlC family protein, partial [Thermoleophilaceae bacterium]